MTDEYLLVGLVGAAHGVRGAVFVRPMTDDPDARFAPGSTLATAEDGSAPLTVEESRVHSGKLVVRFAGRTARAEAEALRGVELFVAASLRPPLEDPDDFYDTDLIGLVATLVDGTPLGPVREVLHPPGGDYLVVNVEGREVLVPFVRSIVPAVDLATRSLTVDPPEGLFDL